MPKKFKAKVLTAKMAFELIDIDAENEQEARKYVALSGARLLGLVETHRLAFSSERQKPFNLSVFNQQLYSLLEAGQTVVDSIDVLGRNDRKGQHRAIYDTLLQTLKEGNQLSTAMAKLPSIFPPLYVAMVKSSETTGSIRSSVKRFMQYQAQVNEIKNKLTAAATYPAVLLGVGFIVISFLLLYVLPRFSAIYEDSASAKGSTVGFVQMWGSFVRNNTLVAWLSLLAVCVVLVTLAVHPHIRKIISRKIIEAPWIGERIWTLQIARMYRTLGMLLKSGVSVLAAMRMTQESLPESMREDLSRATQEISEGKPMSDVLAKYGLSTEIAQRLLLAGESSGNLDEMMERIADFYDQETSTWIDTAGRLIEPALMIAIGLVIGAIVLMLYSPIFELANIA